MVRFGWDSLDILLGVAVLGWVGDLVGFIHLADFLGYRLESYGDLAGLCWAGDLLGFGDQAD